METALLLGLALVNGACAMMGLAMLARPSEGNKLIKLGVMIGIFSFDTGALLGIVV